MGLIESDPQQALKNINTTLTYLRKKYDAAMQRGGRVLACQYQHDISTWLYEKGRAEKAIAAGKKPATDRARMHRALDAALDRVKGNDGKVASKISAQIQAQVQAEYDKLKTVNPAIVRGILIRKFGQSIADKFLRENVEYLIRSGSI